MSKKLHLFLLGIILSSCVFSITSPVNVSPSNGAVGTNVGLSLDWGSVTGNTGYMYQLDTVATFDSPLFVAGNTSTNVSEVYMSNLYFGQKYYWRCAAKSAVDTSAWTNAWNFTTANAITNYAPSNGSNGLAVGVTLDWNSIYGNTGYMYQLDTVATFDSPLFVAGNTSTNVSEVYMSNLYFGQKYYWRCAAKSAVDTSAWTNAWNFTTANAITNYAPSNGSNGLAVGVTLDWNSIYGNIGYIYQLDTVATFDSPLLVAGNTGASVSEVYMSNLYFGQKYYWRAAAKNGVDTSAWTSTWNFTTTNVISNSSPSNGSTGLAVGVTLDWNGITGNIGYLYQLDTVATFDSPLLLAGNTGSSVSEVYMSNLYFGQKYYWRAAAKNGVDTSAWTSAWNFTTSNVISNSSPSNGSTGLAVGVTLDWNGITGNIGYLYQLDTVATFDSPLLVAGNTSASVSEVYMSNLYFGQKYYWRCAAKNAVDTSAWTSTWNFTTTNVISNSSPSNGSTGLAVGVTLDWNGITGNIGYLYQLDTVATFDSPLLVVGNTSASVSEVYMSNLYFGQKYYWRAAAKNGVDTSAWTSAWNFTTGDFLSNTSPSNGALGISINPNLDWSNFNGASGYLCRVDTSLNFNSSQLRNFSVAASQTSVSGLLYGTVYYWQAAARNAVDTSSWNTAWSFKTAYELTSAPVLVSPVNNSENISFPSVGIQWNASAGAVTYQYQYSTNESFTTGVISNSTSLVTGSCTGLYPHTVYYWRVRGANANGYSPWSTVWKFTTESADLVPPVLVAPSNNGTNINPNNLLLDWNSVFGASGYIYEITEDINFVSGITTQMVTETYKTIIGLADGTKYYWRVKSTDGVVQSDWSEVWNFTTNYNVLGIPTLVSPVNNATSVDFTSVTLDWNSVSGASQYVYVLSTDNTFVTYFEMETQILTTVTINDLQPNTQYFWRVKSSNGLIESDWSTVWSFTTEETQAIYYTLTVHSDGGLVFVDDVEYASPINVVAGTSLTLEVIPPLSFEFAQWIGDLTGDNNPETIVMDSDKEVTAEFMFVGLNQEVTGINSISVYPNPAIDNISIIGNGISHITIFSADGKLVMTDNKYIPNQPINISILQPGIYFIKVNNQESGFLKMVKE